MYEPWTRRRKFQNITQIFAFFVVVNEMCFGIMLLVQGTVVFRRVPQIAKSCC